MEHAVHDSEGSTLEHLVEVVSDIRRRTSAPQVAPVAAEALENLVKCVNCGYVQQGQTIDRCPECGLLWASVLHDPTCWSYEPNAVSWFRTVLGVLTWDHRTRVRTSLIPATPESARFARLCTLVAACFVGLAAAAAHCGGSKSATPPFVILAATVLLGGSFGYGVLRLAMWVMQMSLQGVWRRELRFVPASIHYAAAWWPCAAAGLLFLAAVLTHEFREEDRVALRWFVVLFGTGTWAIWMWASVSESGHVRFPGVRIASVVIMLMMVVAPAGSWVLTIPQTNPLRLVASAMTGPDGLRSVGRVAVAKLTNAPRTYALFVDCIADNDERLVRRVVGELGSAIDTTVALTGEGATLDAIEKAFYDLGGKIRKGDRFVLYVNGHGSQYGSGAILVGDGLLLVQKLRYLVGGIPTKQCFLVIDSCFGGKFVDGLRNSCDAVVLASTDDRNLSFRSGLTPFWRAMEDPEADWDGDGRITVKEAFLHSYRRMTKQGEETRQQMVSRMSQNDYQRRLAGIDTLSPQLETLGEANSEDFYVATPQKSPATSQPAS